MSDEKIKAIKAYIEDTHKDWLYTLHRKTESKEAELLISGRILAYNEILRAIDYTLNEYPNHKRKMEYKHTITEVAK